MARYGFGHAFVPLGVSRSMNVPEKNLLFPKPALFRNIALVARAGTFADPLVQLFFAQLKALGEKII